MILKFRRVAVRFGLCVITMFLATGVHGQNPSAGRIVYTTPQVVGQKSCSDNSCHTANPSDNVFRILNGADDPGAIGRAINLFSQMNFLRNKLTTAQFVDLAAYLGNPGATAGAPTAQLNPAALVFPGTTVGASAATQTFLISNTGTAPLVVSGVSSSNADFSIAGSCSSIAAGGSCSVSVGFTPSAAGARSGTITVSHNATGGSSTMSVSGTATAPVILTPGIQVAPTSLDFGSVTVGSFSTVQLVTVLSVGNAPLTLNAISIAAGGDFSIIAGSCAVGVPIATGNNCSVQVSFQPTVEGVQTRTLSISNNAGTTAAISLSGTGVANTSSNLKTMVEYVYVPLNYFFITSRADDKAALDAIAGFRRTGLSFPVYAAQTGNSKAISRFYFDKVAVNGLRGSHFYTLLDTDKAALTALNPGNAQTPRLPYSEGVDSWAFLPLVAGVGGACASGQMPVYRLFRNVTRFPDDPNHRFTADVATYNAFVALGWDGEGVSFCVPLP
jgi:hypothetical protein